MTADLLIVLALMLANGVFAGAEIAVLTLRKTRLAELLEQRHSGAAAVEWLRRQPERFLATVQIGITVVGTTAAAFGGERIADEVGRTVFGGAGPWAKGLGLLTVVLGISVLGIVVGELVPKSLALRHPERYALTMGPVLRLMAGLVKPAVWTLTAASNAVLRLFGDRTSFSEARLSPDELQELLAEASRTGLLDPQAGDIASRAIEFRHLRAVDVMVSRGRIVSVPLDADERTVREALRGRRFARLPIHEGNADNIVGYLAVKDLFARGSMGGDLIRRARFVPETMTAVALLRRMQRERTPLVIVVDENGVVSGLITTEDLLEELVGEISSEQDAPLQPLALDPQGSVDLPGDLPLREINRQLGIELLEPDDYSTVAGLCLHLAGRIPAPGAHWTLAGGLTLAVLEVTPRKVLAARLTVPRPPADAPPPE